MTTYRNEIMRNLKRKLNDLFEKGYEKYDEIINISSKLQNLHSPNKDIAYLQEEALFMEEYSVKSINAEIEILKSSRNKVAISSIDDVVAFLCEKRSNIMKEIDKIEKRIKELS